MNKKTIFTDYLLIFLVFISLGVINTVDASPSFPEQIISNDSFAYFPEGYFEDDTDSLSLERAYYNSDGKTLDATLILHGKSGFETNNTLSYGMLIDSDTDFNTGIMGFDYRYRVQWNNGTWSEIYEKLPTFSIFPKNLEKPHNIDNPFIPDVLLKDGLVRSTVDLKLDLAKIGSPASYSVVFFTEGHMKGKTPLIQDVLSLAVIPPLNFVVSTYPSPLSFESSTEKDVHILIDSTFTENAKIYYNIQTDANNTSIKQLSDNSIVLQNGKAEIPILLRDNGHSDIQVHQLYVNLNPWYELNPKTDAERGGEIYLSYNFRNTPEFEPYVVLWTSLPQPPLMDLQTAIQVVMLIFTIIAAGFGIFTYRANLKFGNYLRDDKHTRDILGVYDLMLSLICKVDHYTKQLTLKYPKQESDRSLIKAGIGDLGIGQNHELKEFDNKTIELYDSALQHLKSYDKLNEYWKDVQNTMDQYNEKVKSLKTNIRQLCLKTIHEKLPNFKQYDGNVGNAFYIDAIEFEAYGVLEDAMHGREPILVPFGDYIKFKDLYDGASEDDGGEYNAYLSSTLFSSPKPLPDQIDEILGCVLEDSLKNQYLFLIDLEQKAQNQLNVFRHELTSLVKDLTAGMHIKGKCKLKY